MPRVALPIVSLLLSVIGVRAQIQCCAAVLMYHCCSRSKRDSTSPSHFVFPLMWEKSEVYSFGINGIMGKSCESLIWIILNALTSESEPILNFPINFKISGVLYFCYLFIKFTMAAESSMKLFFSRVLFVETSCAIMERPYMMSAKFIDFLTHSLHCPHLDQIFTLKFTQPPLLHLLLINPPM